MRHAGADPRIALREEAGHTPEVIETIGARLGRLDTSSRHGPWTADALGMIETQPGRRAPDLARQAGRETLAFKADVRKLKEMGLTESLEVGYRLSPRGAAYLQQARATSPQRIVD